MHDEHEHGKHHGDGAGEHACCGGNANREAAANQAHSNTDHGRCDALSDKPATAIETGSSAGHCNNEKAETPSSVGSCCAPAPAEHGDHCHDTKQKADKLLWICLAILTTAYLLHLLHPFTISATPTSSEEKALATLMNFSNNGAHMVNDMGLGMLIGILSIGLMNLLPKQTIMNALGKTPGVGAILRASVAGVVLDMCNHGLLLVAGKLYRSGVRYSQVLAFLIASPWNSFSLTIVMLALIGIKWTLIFITLSLVVAIITGLILQVMENRGLIPVNPHTDHVNNEEPITVRAHVAQVRAGRGLFKAVFVDGFRDSRMIMRWLLLGMVIATSAQTFVSTEHMQTWFGPTLLGLGMTVVVATLLEVCSEGLLPLAADILNRAGAAGNAFTFLMAGVSTDYTEMLVLRETTGSWRMAFLLPLITLPQILALGVLLNSGIG